ncbi:hypothetical protein KNE206_48060 [Kitasatospora sp. NE20-6]|uniref:hypothetical protein n=1 Tax=Kitasatospora sp. NE20-6 TaxID=2859066 RepID=UPI0034DBFBFC
MDPIGSVPGAVAGAVPAVLSAVVLMAADRAETRARQALAATAGPPRPATDGLDLYELAFLASRATALLRVPATVLVRMHAEGRLAVTGKEYGTLRLRVLDPVPRDDAEAALLDEIGGEEGSVRSPLSWHEQHVPCMARLHDRLVADGLLCEWGLPDGVPSSSPAAVARKAAQARARRLRNAAVVALLAAGAAFAFLSGSWLPLAVQTGVLAVVPVLLDRRPPMRRGITAAGEAARRAATATPLPADAELLRRVALYGVHVLPEDHPLAPVPAPPGRPRDPDPPREEFDLGPPGLGGL